MNKKLFNISLLSAVLILSGGMALAATPDGMGPWADTAVLYLQGLKKGGAAVDANRSVPQAALGVAETTGTPSDANTTPTNFFSLGFGGTITLSFDNAIVNGAGNDVMVYEVTGGVYPDEKIMVEASHNGVDWVLLSSSAVRDAQLDLGILPCAKFIRITDVSNPALFTADADGYDLDAVIALNNGTTCDAGASISVDKSSDKSEVLSGETVNYTYTVTNSGSFDLDEVALSDDKCTVISGPSGDNGNSILEGGETWTYVCSMPLSQTTTNTATVSAKDPWDHDVTGTDSLTVAVRQLGCTLTQGYWKNHSIDSRHYDATWALLANSSFWLDVLNTPVKGNAWYILAHQYVAAQLNVLNGAYAYPDVQTAISQAGSLLGPAPYTPAKADKGTFTTLASFLAGFNEGLTLVPHCSEI